MDKVYTGPNSPMLFQIKENIRQAKRIQIAVSFLKESGVNLIADALKDARRQGTQIEILTSDYLGITEPNALYRLKDILGNDASIRIYKENLSFHPKAYFFEFEEKSTELFIGSSNLSKSALTTGVEWNFRLMGEENSEEIAKYQRAYNELIDKHSIDMTMEWLREYLKNYRRPNPNDTQKTKIKTDVEPDVYPDDNPDHEFNPDKTPELTKPVAYINDKVIPMNAQIAGLVELAMTREEGYDKALTVMATGLGKTYLSAFDSQPYERILFVAHREEILKQAAKTFSRVHKEKTLGFFDGSVKNTEADVIFASVSTLGRRAYLNEDYFKKDAFDYIIVDEFHHAAAKLYTRVLEYFQPKFLHGLTATPERRDSKDVFHFCDYNIAYQCNFHTGINHGWLCPFEYYGIFDETDYSQIPWRNGRYDIHELQNQLIIESHLEQIYLQYRIHQRRRTIAFCAGVRHANALEEYFAQKGVRCKAIHYGCKNRKVYIQDFRKGKLDILFAVDMFNEGFDVPEIDMAMFLRPTQSYSIFIQQLGRGLRLSKNKANLKVLDFVGNYRGFEFVVEYLTGEPGGDPVRGPLKLPEGCAAHFDLKLIEELHKSMLKKTPMKNKLITEYDRIKLMLGMNPTIIDMLNYSEYPVKMYRKQFGSWMRFQHEVDDLDQTGMKYLDTIAEDLLVDLEKTPMSKSYKIPCIRALVEIGLNEFVSLKKVGESFFQYYQSKRHMRDLHNKNHKGAEKWSGKKYEKLAWNNPIHFLSTGASAKFFVCDKKAKSFGWSPEVWDIIKNDEEWFAEEIRERLEMRSQDYFRRRF